MKDMYILILESDIHKEMCSLEGWYMLGLEMYSLSLAYSKVLYMFRPVCNKQENNRWALSS